MTSAVQDKELAILKAETAAAATIARLQSESFDKAWSEEDVRALLAGPGALGLIASFGDTPVGYVIARSTGEEAELLSIGVSYAARRAGVGLALLRHLQTTLRELGTTKLFLEVDATNRAAVELYSREDFRKIGTRKLYYKTANGKRNDALVLRKVIRLPVDDTDATQANYDGVARQGI